MGINKELEDRKLLLEKIDNIWIALIGEEHIYNLSNEKRERCFSFVVSKISRDVVDFCNKYGLRSTEFCIGKVMSDRVSDHLNR